MMITTNLFIAGVAASLVITPPCGANNQYFNINQGLQNELNQSYFIKQKNSKEIKQKEWKKGWATTTVNIRKKPSVDSKILSTLLFNEKIKFIKENKKWVKIKYKNKYAYVRKKYVSKEKNESEKYNVPSYSGYKSWMDYRTITLDGSDQKFLQDEYAYTGTYGIRQINGRYCVAIGSYFTEDIGQYFDLILENGTVIPCILADQKADEDTDSDGIFTLHNGCATEFIVDTGDLNYAAKRDGDISSCCDDWDSPVAQIKIYEKNILE